MRVLVATDAWRPQVNGVVRSLEYLASEAPSLGADIDFLTPGDFRTLPLPGYREIRLALASAGRIERAITAMRPDSVHLATEGRSGGSHAMSARPAAIRSRPAITPAFPNIWRRGYRCR